MGRWRDGEPVPGGVQADGAHRRRDRREAIVELVEPRSVQPQVLDPLLEHPGRHGPADDVAGEQLVDEALAAAVAQERPVAAQRLREEGPGHGGMMQCGGVELHELDVGDGDAGAQRHRQPIRRRLSGVGRHCEQLAGATRRHQDVGRRHTARSSLRIEGEHTATPSALHDQVQGEPTLHHRGGRLPHGLHERTLDLGAGGCTARVDDARPGVPTLPRQEEPTFGVPVEHRAEGYELVHASGPLSHERPHRVDVAESCSDGESVGEVEVGGVLVAADGRGDPTLGPSGRRLAELGLGEDADAHARVSRGADGGREPGHPAAQDQQVQAVRGLGSCSQLAARALTRSLGRLRASTWRTRGR